MNQGLTKRQKIIVVTVIVTFAMLSTQMVDFGLRFRFLAALGVLTYFLSLFALWEGLTKVKAVLLMILPTLFTLGVASFYFLLPVRWLTRLPVALVFGLSFYSLMLSQNVFNVASIRTIPLYRAASTVAFLFTLITAFFLFNVIYAFNMLFVLNGLVVFLVSFLLIVQLLWAVEMESLTSSILIQSLVLSLVLGELAMVFSFWPLSTTIWSLSLASAMYVLVGLSLHFLKERLSGREVWEYLTIGALVFLISFLTSSWG